MITGLILFSIIAFVGVISYRRPRLEERVIKNIPLIDWMISLIFPMFGYFALVLIVRNIVSRNRLDILDFDDLTFASFFVFFVMYAFVGNSIHFVGKVLSRHITPNRHARIHQINEIFHGKLSHYLFFVSTVLAIFTLALWEINHPLLDVNEITQVAKNMTIFFGSLLGYSSAKAIFNTSGWFGGYNKPLFFLISFLLGLLLMIFSAFRLNLVYYPVNLFVISMFATFVAVFLFRQFLIFSRLGKKRRLQFLTKILSA